VKSQQKNIQKVILNQGPLEQIFLLKNRVGWKKIVPYIEHLISFCG